MGDSLWEGNLRNTPVDIAIDCTLLLAMATAYIPQITRIIGHRSTQGLSPLFLLFGAMCCNLQLANTILFAAYAWPTNATGGNVLELIHSGQLKGFKAFGAILGLIQVAFQWACSITLVTLFTTYDCCESSIKRTTVATTLFIHAALFLFPAISIALPTPSPSDWDNSLFTGFSIVFNTWIALFLAVLQFWPQFLEHRRRSGAPEILSLLSIGMQAIVLVALAVRWQQRLGPTTWGRQSVPLWYWFQWGWLPFIYFIYGIVYAGLLGIYLLGGGGGSSTRVGILEEETPLLPVS